jgi:hypothetical protein
VAVVEVVVAAQAGIVEALVVEVLSVSESRLELVDISPLVEVRTYLWRQGT